MDSNCRIIELLQILASEPKPSPGFELQEDTFEQLQQLKHVALRSLAQHQSNRTVFQMFARINAEMPAGGGTRDQVLHAAQQLSRLLLPVFRRAQAEEAKLTNYAKYLREAATRDPFLENASLTRDAFAGMGEIESDSWAEGMNLERRR